MNSSRSKIHGTNCTSMHAEHDALLKLARLNRKKIQRMVALIVRFRIDKKTGEIHLLSSAPCIQCTRLLYYAGIRKIIVPKNNENILEMRKLNSPDEIECPISFAIQKYKRESPTFLNSMYGSNSKRQQRRLYKMGFPPRRRRGI